MNEHAESSQIGQRISLNTERGVALTPRFLFSKGGGAVWERTGDLMTASGLAGVMITLGDSDFRQFGC